jgi:alpha/beta superfamily hydrolase
VAVAGEEEVRIAGYDGGPSLEARLHAPPGARRAIVLCHPHPLYGGSMHSPVPLAIAKTLSDRAGAAGAGSGSGAGVAWVRFDFRGVGASEGKYDEGRGEVDDARAVIAHMQRLVPGVPLTVCGHSFGSWVGLRAAVESTPGAPAEARDRRDGVERVLLVAPSVRFFDFRDEGVRFAGPKAIFVGSEDEFMDPDEARALAARIGASLRIFEGFDHHFLRSRRALAEAALPFLAPEVFPQNET